MELLVSPDQDLGLECRISWIFITGTTFAAHIINMATISFIIGGAWLLASIVFVVGLAVAAKRPVPNAIAPDPDEVHKKESPAPPVAELCK